MSLEASAYAGYVDPNLRRVTQLPLTELWDNTGIRAGRVIRDDLSEGDVQQLLRRGLVQFVEIRMGERPSCPRRAVRILEAMASTEADAMGTRRAHLHRRVPGLHRIGVGNRRADHSRVVVTLLD
jgi:hypothetical protein